MRRPEAAARLVRFYEAGGNTAEAERWRAEVRLFETTPQSEKNP
jgi:hypothetical protein